MRFLAKSIHQRADGITGIRDINADECFWKKVVDGDTEREVVVGSFQLKKFRSA